MKQAKRRSSSIFSFFPNVALEFGKAVFLTIFAAVPLTFIWNRTGHGWDYSVIFVVVLPPMCAYALHEAALAFAAVSSAISGSALDYYGITDATDRISTYARIRDEGFSEASILSGRAARKANTRATATVYCAKALDTLSFFAMLAAYATGFASCLIIFVTIISIAFVLPKALLALIIFSGIIFILWRVRRKT